MRVWEFSDNNATPADLVREQDFIMRVRHLHRASVPSLVLNFVLGAIDSLTKTRGALEAAQQKLQIFAQATKGTYFEMSSGDAFIIWEKPDDTTHVATKAIEAALTEHSDSKHQFLLSYILPENYAALRERANHYIDTVRVASNVGHSVGGIDDTKGRLTAKNVDQIEQLLGEIDLRRYGRTQHIYRDTKTGWEPAGEEYFISFEDLRRERFPKLEVVASEHFFFSICGILDQKLLAQLAVNYGTIAGRVIHLNLSIASIMGAVFTQFVHSVPRDQRHLICFELHRGDLFQDFSLTLSAIDALRHEGFRVAIDSVTPDMVPYLNLGSFPVDALKLNVSKDRLLQLNDPVIRKALAQIPSDKLIFFRCDNDRALAVGREMGVSVFQGWLIDDLVKKA